MVEFWPGETGSPQTYGPVKVEMTGESNDRGVTVRDFTVKNAKVSCTSWHILQCPFCETFLTQLRETSLTKRK